jgi:hypothetical protein
MIIWKVLGHTRLGACVLHAWRMLGACAPFDGGLGRESFPLLYR